MPLLSPTNGVEAPYENRKTTISLSILLAIFPGGPGLAGTRMSPCWIMLEPRMMEMVVTTGATRRAQLQWKLNNNTLTQNFLMSVYPFKIWKDCTDGKWVGGVIAIPSACLPSLNCVWWCTKRCTDWPLHIYPSSVQVPALKVELGLLLAATL